MKKLLFASAFAAAMLVAATTTVSAATAAANYSHEYVSEDRPMTLDYKSVDVAKNVRLIIEDRTDGDAVVSTTADILPYVFVNIQKDKISVGINKGVRVPKDECAVEIRLPFSNRLESVSVSGASEVQILPMIKSSKFTADVSGSSKFAAGISTAKCTLKGSGNSTIECPVESRNLTLNVGGGSMFTGEVNVSSKSTISLGGTSMVTISGSSTNAKITAGGSSTLKASDLSIGTCNIGTKGSAVAEINCDKTLSAKAEGSSSIRYSGRCRPSSLTTKGMSRISKL